MSLLFLDGFDHYNTNAQLLAKWTASSDNTIAPTTGSASRWSGGRGLSLSNNQWVKFFTSANATWDCTFGVSLYRTSSSATASLRMVDPTGTPITRFDITAAGAVDPWNWLGTGYGWSNATSAAGVIPPNQWVHVTVYVRYAAAGGVLLVVVNGVTVLNYTGITTKDDPSPTMTLGGVYLSGTSADAVYFDDAFVSNQYGLDASNTIAAVRMQAVLPTGAGDSTQFTRIGSGASTNWGVVAQSTPPDSFDTYLFGAADGQSDLYSMAVTGGPIPSGKTVYGFVMRWWAQANGSTPCGFAPLFKYTGLMPNPYIGATRLLSPSGLYYATPIYTALPDGSAALAPGSINAMQIGLMAAHPTAIPNPPQGTQFLYLPANLLTHADTTPYSVRVTALAPEGGVATDAASLCTAFTVSDTGLAQVSQLLLEVLRTI